MAGLQRLRYHVHDDDEARGEARPATAFRGDGDEPDVPAGPFTSDEGAARFYLEQLLLRDGRQAMRSAAAPERPEQAAGMVVSREHGLEATGTRVVRFEQHHDDIPVFGAEGLVELDQQRSLVAADVRVGAVEDVGSVPTIDHAEAVQKAAAAVEETIEPAEVPPPSLVYFHDDEHDRWHLAWHVRSMPGIPAEARPEPGERSGHGIGTSFRARHARTDFLIDAHDGSILYYYGATPTVAIGVPVKCKGIDEDGQSVDFWGARFAEGGVTLYDPLRRVRTFDLSLGDIDDAPLPRDPVVAESASFGEATRAAVTAHRHASIVQDFYKTVLQRDGIDDRGMELVSVVNCTWRAGGAPPPPEWKNAVWSDKRMWYGQVKGEGGRLVSLARFLDVIAHELSHGVIESTAGLVYRDQSGALNESIADIFGVIIANSYRAPVPDDVTTWNWEIGQGLMPDGTPLRHFADPGSLGYPAHMDEYRRMSEDYGGVHVNSSIHNKAVHNILTATGADGRPVMAPNEVALVLYLALVHLHALADFADAREKAIEVALVYFSGDEAKRAEVESAIAAAYEAVGITARQ